MGKQNLWGEIPCAGHATEPGLQQMLEEMQPWQLRAANSSLQRAWLHPQASPWSNTKPDPAQNTFSRACLQPLASPGGTERGGRCWQHQHEVRELKEELPGPPPRRLTSHHHTMCIKSLFQTPQN